MYEDISPVRTDEVNNPCLFFPDEGRGAWRQGLAQAIPGEKQRPDFDQCLLSHEAYNTWETSGRGLPITLLEWPKGHHRAGGASSSAMKGGSWVGGNPGRSPSSRGKGHGLKSPIDI